MKFELGVEDYVIILNALHYYKKVEKRPNFAHFTEEKINNLSDMVKSAVDIFSKANDAAVNLKHLWNIKDDEM